MILPLDSNAGNSLLDTYHCRLNIDFAFIFVVLLLFKICYRKHEIPFVNPSIKSDKCYLETGIQLNSSHFQTGAIQVPTKS